MPIKVKGFFKGIKCISQIFAYKEHEMDIGYPTDVQHIAHIGCDATSGHAPSWMNEFRSSSNFPVTLAPTEDPPQTSQAGFDQCGSIRKSTDTSSIARPSNYPKELKKKKRKKNKVSSPAVLSKSFSTSRSSRSIESFTTAFEEADEMYRAQF